jgi:hypothetical protein
VGVVRLCCGTLQCSEYFAIKERPQDPLSHPCRDGSQARGLREAFLYCSQKALGFVSTCLEDRSWLLEFYVSY